MIYGLDLFAGTGVGSFVLENILPGYRTVAYYEEAPYRQAILRARQADGFITDSPINDDVRTADWRPFAGVVDILTAGFPCQPFSVAGKKQGSTDARNLWPDTLRAISGVGPRCVVLENVPGLLTHNYFGDIIGSLTSVGYDCEWDVIPASVVGATHKRDRLWIVGNRNPRRPHGNGWWLCGSVVASGRNELADSKSVSQRAGSRAGGSSGVRRRRPNDSGGQVDDQRPVWLQREFFTTDGPPATQACGDQSTGSTYGSFRAPPNQDDLESWLRVLEMFPLLKPALCRVADDVPFWMDRVAALGDAWCAGLVANILTFNQDDGAGA